MTVPAPDDFDAIIHNLQQPAAPIDPTPYGAPATHAPAAKPGLTKRGKAAIGIGAAVLAGTTLIGYQIHASNAAEQAAKAQEIALKSQALRLEELRELNKANDKNRTIATTEAKTRQASVDTCVKDHDHLVGKGYGAPSYGDIVKDCQSQYGTSTNTADMQAAASTTDTDNTGTGGGGGGNDGVLIGVLALGAVAVFGARKATRNAPAQ